VCLSTPSGDRRTKPEMALTHPSVDAEGLAEHCWARLVRPSAVVLVSDKPFLAVASAWCSRRSAGSSPLAPRPINAVKITIYNTKHTQNTKIHSTKSPKSKNEYNKIKSFLFGYISKYHNSCFVYFV
jgi:hypothetical protein